MIQQSLVQQFCLYNFFFTIFVQYSIVVFPTILFSQSWDASALQAKILANSSEFFYLMFQTVRNGKIPTSKLEQCLEHLQQSKPILKDLGKDWASETGAFAFMQYNVFRILNVVQGMVGHNIDTRIVIKFWIPNFCCTLAPIVFQSLQNSKET